MEFKIDYHETKQIETIVKMDQGFILNELKALDKNNKKIIITDQRIAALYPELLIFPYHIVPEKEQAKTIATCEKVINELLKLEITKSDLLIGLGGGSIGDLTGFIAQVYKRGMDFILIPTTLLAQVDASIGGKNALNFKQAKNIMGTIYQPKSVLIDTDLLQTLPPNEFKNGFAEIIKYALLFSPKLFEKLEEQKYTLFELIKESIQIKTKVVSKDQFEEHLRYALNFGHTIGHALEALSNYTLSHGEAIAWGMVLEIEQSKLQARVFNLLQAFGLLTPINFTIDEIFQTIRNDKKRQNELLILPKLQAIGTFTMIKQEINAFRKGINDEYLRSKH